MVRHSIVILLIFAVSCSLVASHGSMVWPTTWFDYPIWMVTTHGIKHDYAGMKSKQQCTAGSKISRKVVCTDPYNCDGAFFPGSQCFWFTNNTVVEKPTLFDPKLRTFTHVPDQKVVLHNPWRAPGAAPIDSPCGAAGGNPNGCGAPTCGHGGGGFSHGVRAEHAQFTHEIFVTNWTRGDEVEVAWSILVNHGGGYSYRLCKLPEEGRKGLTEECFQQTPLDFVGDTQWVQYGEDKSTRLEIPAVRTDQGTTPSGSQWTRNPIPACNGQDGGFHDPDCTNGTQFPPPGPHLYGFGVDKWYKFNIFGFSIVDKVKIPKDLEPGNYVLSFRWDCEQGAQVWNTCSSILLH